MATIGGRAAISRIFTSIPANIREWTRYLQNLFFQKSFTMTFLGTTVPLTGTSNYTVSAGIVTLSIPYMQGTSDETVAYINGFPPEITPRRSHSVPIIVTNNGVDSWGVLVINTDTPHQVFVDPEHTPFDIVGDKGVKGTTITFALD